MHTDHKTVRWCAVLAALIVAIAAIAVTSLQTVPAGVPAAVDIEGGGQPAAAVWQNETEDTAAIKAMPEEMPETLESKDLQAYEAKKPEEEQSRAQVSGHAHPVNVTVKVDDMTMHLMSAPVTVGEMLETYNIPVGKDDIVKPAADQQLTADTEVTVQRISFDEVVVSESVPFKTKVEETDKLPAKTEKVVQKGKKGEDKVTFRVTYADGEEIDREEISRERVKEPVTEIVQKSTVGLIEGAEYSRKFTVKAYSYTGGGRTASGLPAAVGRIAVDPSVIPLGTKVYVEGYGFATAADTGGNIKGKTIDVYYNSVSQCRSWGCRYITIYILK